METPKFRARTVLAVRICPSSRPPKNWRSIERTTRYSGRPPFSITLMFPDLDAPDFARARDLSRGAAECREQEAVRYRCKCAFWPADAERLRRVFEIVGRAEATEVLIDDRRCMRGGVAPARLVLHPADTAVILASSETERDLTRLERTEASKPSTACSSPAGCPSRRGRRGAASSRWSSSATGLHQNTGDRFRFWRCSRALPPSSICGIGGCAREEKSGTLCQKPVQKSCRRRQPRITSCGRGVPGSAARDGQAARAVRIARRSAP